MDRRSLLALTLAAMTLSAGCLGQANPLASSNQSSTREAPSQTGAPASLEVTVTDPSIRPVPGANVTVETSDGTRTARTDASGSTTLSDLDPGPAVVRVEAEDHRGRRLTVDLDAGERAEQNVVLRPEPANGTFVQRFAFNGFFECSATYLIVAGDCLAAAHAVSEQAGGPRFNATNQRFTFPFPVHEDWETIHVTQTWEDPTVGTGSMMRINLEPRNPNQTGGHSPQYADADGTSPLELTVESGELHENASSEEMIVPEDGGWLRTRTFHLGLTETHNPGGTDFLGVGAAVQQEFSVVVEVTYG